MKEPKEKAKELIHKVDSFIHTSDAHISDENSVKKCALLLVDEATKAIIYHKEGIGKMKLQDSLKYWYKVQKEIITFGI